MTDEEKLNPNLEADIERANIQVAMARGREKLDEAFKMVRDLIPQAPSDRKLLSIAKRLVEKDKELLPQIRRLYREHDIPFGDEKAEQIGEELKRNLDSGNFENIDKIAQEAQAAGVSSDPVIQDRLQRATMFRQQEGQGIVVPAEIRIKQGRAESTYRMGDYERCRELCEEGLELLENYAGMPDQTYQAIHKQLLNQMEQAQYKLDRRYRLDEGIGLIDKGNWTEARTFFKDALESFPGDDVFENEVDKLESALKEEAEIERQVRQLRGEIEDSEIIIDIQRQLADLPAKVSASSSLTDRQRQIAESLERTKNSMVTRFKNIGSDNLDLSETANTDQEARNLLVEARRYLTVVETLEVNDSTSSEMIKRVREKLQQLEGKKLAKAKEQETKENRNRLLRRMSITIATILGIVVIIFGVMFGINIFREQSISANQTAVAQSNATSTAVVGNSILTADANSTIQVQQTTSAVQTQNAQSTIISITSEARATDIFLTSNAQTVEAQLTQQSLALANQTVQAQATENALGTQGAVQQTQAAATATVSGILTQTASAPTATPLYVCQGVVTITQGVNVREQPSVTSTDVGTVRNGALVEIYDYRPSTNSNIEGWYQIIFQTEAGESQGGWIASNYVAPRGCPENFSG